jgi:uncharacterized membrane protein YfcA
MNIQDFITYDLTLWQWAALGFSGVCIGISKTGINGAITVMIPILARIFGAKESTGVVLPMLCFADLLAVIFYRRNAEWKYILRLLPWALGGFVCALFADSLVPAKHFKILIGICILGGLAVMLWNDHQSKKAGGKTEVPLQERGDKKNHVRGLLSQSIFGIAGGFSTMIGNAAGPVMSVFLLSMRLPKTNFVGTAAWFFMIINYLKIPVQIFAWHNITFSGLKLGVLLTPCIILGAVLGFLLVKKTSEAHYRRLVYIMTLISTALLFI